MLFITAKTVTVTKDDFRLGRFSSIKINPERHDSESSVVTVIVCHKIRLISCFTRMTFVHVFLFNVKYASVKC